MLRHIDILKLLLIATAIVALSACVTMPSPSMPQPPSMPSASPPSSSPPSSPSSSSPPASSSPSQSSGSPSQSSGSPSSSSGSQGTPPNSQAGNPSQSGDSGSPSSPGEGQPSAGGGTPTDLDILEPEPVTNTADASDSMEEPEDSESGGGEAGGGEAGGGEAGGGEQGGGEAGGGEQGGGEAGGGEQGGGSQGGMQGGGSQGGGMQGGGSQGGSLDDALIASVEGFEDGMQQQILIIASASPSNGMDDLQDIGGSEAAGGGELIDQTGGGVPGLIMIEGDVSQLPQGSGQVGGPTTSSGVVNVNDQGSIENRQSRQGDSQIARILIASIPEDIGDGSDDDVVARQIREAAINEQDPVLREKLWQEYRNYKKAMGRKKF